MDLDGGDLREGEGASAFVTVRISREMLAILASGWSPPVRVKITPDLTDGATHTMTAMLAHSRALNDDEGAFDDE